MERPRELEREEEYQECWPRPPRFYAVPLLREPPSRLGARQQRRPRACGGGVCTCPRAAGSDPGGMVRRLVSSWEPVDVFFRRVRQKDADLRLTSGQFVRQRPLSFSRRVGLSLLRFRTQGGHPLCRLFAARLPCPKARGPGALSPGGMMCAPVFRASAQAARVPARGQAGNPTQERGTPVAAPHRRRGNPNLSAAHPPT